MLQKVQSSFENESLNAAYLFHSKHLQISVSQTSGVESNVCSEVTGFIRSDVAIDLSFLLTTWMHIHSRTQAVFEEIAAL